MFDPSYDPYSELERLKNDMLVLQNNQYQLVKSHNEQNQTVLTLAQQIEQIAAIQTRLVRDVQLLKNRVEAWIQLSKVQNENKNNN